MFKKVAFEQTYAYLSKHKLVYKSVWFQEKTLDRAGGSRTDWPVTNNLDSGKLPIYIYVLYIFRLVQGVWYARSFNYLTNQNTTEWTRCLLSGSKVIWNISICRLWRNQIKHYFNYKRGTWRIRFRTLLFIIYIHEATENFKAILYADHTNMTSLLH